MADAPLNGKKVAILVADGFEEVEMTEPRRELEAAGATTLLVSPSSTVVKGFNHHAPGREFKVDVNLDRANADDFDALVLPGGVMNPDTLRSNSKAIRFVQEFAAAGKPIGAICHGPWTLIDAELVRGRRMTSYHSIRTDLINAGAKWVDREVVTDQGLVTSRSPADIPAFCREMIEEFAEGPHKAVIPSQQAHRGEQAADLS